jgi:hypothetical protein
VLEYRNRVRAAIFHALGGMAEAVHDRKAKAEILAATQIGVVINARLRQRSWPKRSRPTSTAGEPGDNRRSQLRAA